MGVDYCVYIPQISFRVQLTAPFALGFSCYIIMLGRKGMCALISRGRYVHVQYEKENLALFQNRFQYNCAMCIAVAMKVVDQCDTCRLPW